MSKFVKDLITDHLKNRLTGVNDALLVNVVGLSANTTSKLRQELRKKSIHLTLVKNSLARRASEGTPLSAAFEGSSGTLALVWGGEDVVSLAKEVTRLMELKEFTGFESRGGALDGSKLSAEEVKAVSKWPSRAEQLSLLMGQVLSPGATLVGQLLSAGGALASQIKQKSEGDEEGDAASAAPSDVAPSNAAPSDAAPAGGDAPAAAAAAG